MRKLLVAPAVLGLGAALVGTTQSRIATADATHRLSTDEMKATQGKGYYCDIRVCRPPEGPSCATWTGWSSKVFYNPGYKCRWVSGSGTPTCPTQTIWCTEFKSYTDLNCTVWDGLNYTPTYEDMCS